MRIEDTNLAADIGSTRELNKYLESGWVLILSYVRHLNDKQQPRFIVAWQRESEAVYPEMLDEWELNEIDRQMNR